MIWNKFLHSSINYHHLSENFPSATQKTSRKENFETPPTSHIFCPTESKTFLQSFDMTSKGEDLLLKFWKNFEFQNKSTFHAFLASRKES